MVIFGVRDNGFYIGDKTLAVFPVPCRRFQRRIKAKKIPVDPLDLEAAKKRLKMFAEQELMEFVQKKREKEQKEEETFREKIEKTLNEKQICLPSYLANAICLSIIRT